MSEWHAAILVWVCGALAFRLVQPESIDLWARMEMFACFSLASLGAYQWGRANCRPVNAAGRTMTAQEFYRERSVLVKQSTNTHSNS